MNLLDWFWCSEDKDRDREEKNRERIYAKILFLSQNNMPAYTLEKTTFEKI